MPWVPEDLEAELPHQNRRLNKPVIPKQDPAKSDTIPSMLPKLRMGTMISLHDEPDDEVAGFKQTG
jgi:hypothetical protein